MLIWVLNVAPPSSWVESRMDTQSGWHPMFDVLSKNHCHLAVRLRTKHAVQACTRQWHIRTRTAHIGYHSERMTSHRTAGACSREINMEGGGKRKGEGE